MQNKMIYIDNIRKALDYIELNLSRPLQLREIAGEAYYSMYHFHRLFHEITGQTLKSYIRKRRMSEAARELIITDKKMTELAIDYGFSSQEAFTRAFEKYFIISPSAYRRFGIESGLMNKLHLESTIPNTIGNELSPPHLLSIPSLQFIGMGRNGQNDNFQNYTLTYKFLQYMPEIRNQTGENYYTLCSSSVTSSGERIYDFYVVSRVTSLRDIPSGMVGIELRPLDYAVFTFKGNREFLTYPEGNAPVYDTIYNRLLPEAGLSYHEPEFTIQYSPSHLSVESEPLQMMIPVHIHF